MSTSFTAVAFYGYSLPHSELTRRKPHPLWGKVKFDPDTGSKVTQYVEERIELGLDSAGDHLPHMSRFTRFDSGYEEREHVLLGIELAKMELSYGAPDPQHLQLVSDADRAKVQDEVKKLLHKAEIDFDAKRMGYYLAGYVG